MFAARINNFVHIPKINIAKDMCKISKNLLFPEKIIDLRVLDKAASKTNHKRTPIKTSDKKSILDFPKRLNFKVTMKRDKITTKVISHVFSKILLISFMILNFIN